MIDNFFYRVDDNLVKVYNTESVVRRLRGGKIMSALFNFCKKYLKIHIIMMIVYISLCIFGSFFSMATPYISGSFIDYLISATDKSNLLRYCILFTSINLCGLALGYFTGKLLMILQTKIGFELNRDIIAHVQRLSLSFLKERDTAYLNQRINNDSNAIVSFCVGVIQNILINAVTIVVPFILLINMNKPIALILFGLILIYFLSYWLFKKPLFRASYDIKETQSEYFGKLYEQISNIPFLKINAISKIFIKRLELAFDKLLHSALRYQKISYMFSGLDSLIMVAAQVTLFLIGGAAVIDGTLSIGGFTIISSYFNMMLGAVRYFFNLGKSVQENMVAYNRLIEIQRMQPESNGDKSLEKIDTIETLHLSFAYSENKVVCDFNLKFEKGQIYVFQGTNGSGKTTFINLLMGLYIDECEGNVFYNGIKVKQIDMLKVRSSLIGVSEQEPILLNDTIKFNLCLGDELKFDKDEVEMLINLLGLETFIKSLPNGLDTIISEKGDNISGGEKQKLSILRTLIKKPDLIVLDEPTSALDKNSRDKFLDYLETIKTDKIIIMVTHDDACLRISDKTVKFVPNTNVEE